MTENRLLSVGVADLDRIVAAGDALAAKLNDVNLDSINQPEWWDDYAAKLDEWSTAATAWRAPAAPAAAERRRDNQGRVWQLLRGPFPNWQDTVVIVATLGWEQDDTVRRDLHIPEDEWASWEVVA